MTIYPGMYQCIKQIEKECKEVEHYHNETPGERSEEDINNDFYRHLDTIKAKCKDLYALMGVK
jgi:hypothetical protein